MMAGPTCGGSLRRYRLAPLAACALLACLPHPTPSDAGTDAGVPAADGGLDPAACARLEHHDTGVAMHTQDCADPTCGNGYNPPTGGLHCPLWIPCREYTSAQPRCNWIHNLEHGHVVLAYNCPSGCPDVVAALEAIRDAQPVASNGVRRILITPDPQIPKRVAAMVWGWSWSGEQIDTAALQCLLAHQDQSTYEYTVCQP
jgi:hypothetical protein